MNILLIVLGIAAGFVIGWLLSKNKNQSSEAIILSRLNDAEREKATHSERSLQQKLQLDAITLNLEEERKNSVELNWKMAQMQTTNENLSEKLFSQHLYIV